MNAEGSDPGAPEHTGAGEFPAPVGFSGALAGAWRLYRGSVSALAGLFLMTSAVVLAIHLGTGRLADALNASPNVELGVALFVPIVAYVALGSIAVAAAGPLLADRVHGRRSSFPKAFATSRSSVRDMVAAGLFAAVVVLCLVAILLPVAPLLFLALPFFYGPPVVAFTISLEKNSLQAGLGRARRLLKGSWLRSAGILVTVALATQLLKVSTTQLFLGLPDGWRLAAIIVLQVVADALLLPFLAAASFIVYLDLRARSEEFGPSELAAEREAAHDAVTASRATPD